MQDFNDFYNQYQNDDRIFCRQQCPSLLADFYNLTLHRQTEVYGFFSAWLNKKRSEEIALLEQEQEYQDGWKSGYYSPFSPLITNPTSNSLFDQGYAAGKNQRCSERR